MHVHRPALNAASKYGKYLAWIEYVSRIKTFLNAFLRIKISVVEHAGH